MRRISILCFSIVTLLVSCKTETKIEESKPLAKHVVLIGSNGFGAYAFKKAEVPNLRRMMEQGAYSLQAPEVWRGKSFKSIWE